MKKEEQMEDIASQDSFTALKSSVIEVVDAFKESDSGINAIVDTETPEEEDEEGNKKRSLIEPPEMGKPLSEEDILYYVKKDIEAAKIFHDELTEKLIRSYNSYHAIIDQKYNIPGRSTIVSSDVMDTIEWMMPSLMRVFTAAQDIIVIEPVGGEDVESAEQHQALINYQFTYKMDGFTKFYTWFKDALIYGLGVVKLTWETFYDKREFSYEELTQEQFQALASQQNISIEAFDEYEVANVELYSPEKGEIERTVLPSTTIYKNVKGFIKRITYSGPWLETIPVSSFYIEPGARSVREANFVAHRVRRTLDYLKRMQREGVYHNVENLIPNVEGDEEDYDKYYLLESQSKHGKDVDDLPDIPGREYKWVWECWVKLDVDGDGLLEPLLVTICDDVVLRVEENPFDHGEPPFETIVPIIDCHKIYGVSITDLVLEFQRLKTALYRNVFDNVAFSINNWFLVRRDSGTDITALAQVKPGSVVFTEDVNEGVREMTPRPLPPGIFNLFEYLDSSKENRTGVTRYNQGLNAASLNKTATGISAIMTASQQRIELIARLFAETGVKHLFRKMISLNQQFITNDFVLRLFGKPLMISPDKLDGSFDLMVNVGIGAGLKELQQSQMINLLNIMPNLAQLGLVTPKHIYYVISKLLESMGYKNIESFIQNPGEQTSLQTKLGVQTPQAKMQSVPVYPIMPNPVEVAPQSMGNNPSQSTLFPTVF